MSITLQTRVLGAAFAALLTLGAGGVGCETASGDSPHTPKRTPSSQFPTADELRLCDRRVPIPRC